MKGVIKKIFKDKGFGFIGVDGQPDVFFHKTAVRNVPFTDLVEGQKVTFEVGEGAKGPRAEDVYV